jgi:hypothetical protein
MRGLGAEGKENLEKCGLISGGQSAVELPDERGGFCVSEAAK